MAQRSTVTVRAVTHADVETLLSTGTLDVLQTQFFSGADLYVRYTLTAVPAPLEMIEVAKTKGSKAKAEAERRNADRTRQNAENPRYTLTERSEYGMSRGSSGSVTTRSKIAERLLSGDVLVQAPESDQTVTVLDPFGSYATLVVIVPDADPEEVQERLHRLLEAEFGTEAQGGARIMRLKARATPDLRVNVTKMGDSGGQVSALNILWDEVDYKVSGTRSVSLAREGDVVIGH